MTGATWPTNDDNPSPAAPEKLQESSQQLNHSLSDLDDDNQSSERSDDEPAMFIPLHMILVPTEEEKNRYIQNTPPSPRHYPDFRDSDNEQQKTQNKKEQFNREENKHTKDHQLNNSKRPNDPQWADQDFSESLYLAQSLPSPPQSPQSERKRRHHRLPAHEAIWRDSGEDEPFTEKRNEEVDAQENLDNFEY